MRSLLVASVLAALVGAGQAQGARFAVGLHEGVAPDRVAARIAAATGGTVSRDLLPLGALTLEARHARGVSGLPGVRYVERIDTRRRLAFAPADPLASRQWYLTQARAFDSWAEPPPLIGTLVAVIDSGIDGEHPELAARIADARSFVGGKATVDQQGHGTFVAGIIAAEHNGQGIAGIAFPAELLVAKVVGPDRTISLEAEVKAIRWAVDSGARVINLSLGGLRDPINSKRDTYSALEASAIDYAYRNGAVLVAAVGNADQAPNRPWPWANYPAALPHVLGVSAITREGSVPSFSNRDRIYNDIAAAGQDIFSTFPRALTAARPGCVNQGYSDCGTDEYRHAEGTSFAAPQVSAAAALLFSVRPELTPDQVMYLLTRTASDASPLTGCRQCLPSRDAYSGWGRLDIAAAVAEALGGKLPRSDRLETNDNAGRHAQTIWGRRQGKLDATIDFWDDQNDVYRLRLYRGQRLFAHVRGPLGARLYLWRPGTSRVEGLSVRLQRMRVAQSVQRGSVERIAYRVPRGAGGLYYLQVKMESPGAGSYALTFTKQR